MKSIIIMLAMIALCDQAAHAQVAVIVNKSVGAASLSAAQCGAIFSLDNKTWPNGDKVVVFDSKNSTTKGKFFGFIGKTDGELKKIWMRVQLSGGGKAPESLGSDEEIVAKVASTPGAIGYVGASAAGGSVKVVTTVP